jgi:hypothetical protein
MIWKNTIKQFFLFPFCLLLLLSACSEIDPTDCSRAECSGFSNVVRLAVKDSSNRPVALDSYSVIRLPDSIPITFNLSAEEYEKTLLTGLYPVADDQLVASRENTQMYLAFTGLYKSHKYERKVRLNIDCCHVSPAGDSSIVIPHPTASDCKTVTCTGNAEELFMQIRYPDNTPVTLDTFQLVDVAKKTPIRINIPATDFAAMQSSGNYLLAHDSLLVAGNQNRRMAIEFTGILRIPITGIIWQLKVTRTIIVDVDCCHISHFYGDLTMVMDPAS